MTKILYIPSGQYLSFANRHYFDVYNDDTYIFEESFYSADGIANFITSFMIIGNFNGIKYRSGVPEDAGLVIEEFEIIYD